MSVAKLRSGLELQHQVLAIFYEKQSVPNRHAKLNRSALIYERRHRLAAYEITEAVFTSYLQHESALLNSQSIFLVADRSQGRFSNALTFFTCAATVADGVPPADAGGIGREGEFIITRRSHNLDQLFAAKSPQSSSSICIDNSSHERSQAFY